MSSSTDFSSFNFGFYSCGALFASQTIFGAFQETVLQAFEEERRRRQRKQFEHKNKHKEHS